MSRLSSNNNEKEKVSDRVRAETDSSDSEVGSTEVNSADNFEPPDGGLQVWNVPKPMATGTS